MIGVVSRISRRGRNSRIVVISGHTVHMHISSRKKDSPSTSDLTNYYPGARKRVAGKNELDRKSQDVNVDSRASSSAALVDRQSSPKLTGEINDAEAVGAVVQAPSSVKFLAGNSEINWETMRRFEEFALRSYVARSQRLNILPSLSQFNFIRALLTNVNVLGLSPGDMHDAALSPFNLVAGPDPVSSRRERLSQLPAGLRPTALQRETPHHPWFDLLPAPAMRDNLVRLGPDAVDKDDLCHAMCGKIPGQTPGVLVWGEAWDAEGWELTEEFVKSWGWVVANCWGLMRSTNRWRMQRGEKPLFYL